MNVPIGSQSLIRRVTGEVPASTVRGLNRALRTALTYSVRLSASDATFESHDMCCSEMGC